MKAIDKWCRARETHEKLVERARGWCNPNSVDIGLLSTVNNYGVDVQALTVDWIASRRADLYRDLIAFSRSRLAAAAREALAECEQVRADAEMDLGSIEEDAKQC